MNLQRILQMSHTEIICRTMQKATKSIEHMASLANDITHQPPCLFDQLKPDPVLVEFNTRLRSGKTDGAEKSLQEHFNQTATDYFFDGAVDDRIPALFTRHFPEVRESTIAGADLVCRGQFDILGYGRLDFGNPVQWNLDPISRRRTSPIHWSRINPLDPQMAGDSKVIWELNRHQWLIELGQAYQFTGEEKYAEVFAAYINEWMEANPPGLGINWSSSLEVAMRLICWCWALMLFRNSKALDPALFVNMLAWIGTHASYVERYLSYYYSPNTHLTGEALGLYYAGLICPEFRSAYRWRKLGRQILEDQIERQVYTDGVYFEQSTRYQHYTAEIYLHFLILARQSNESVAPVVMERVQQMFDFLLRVRQPDGSLPQIGDADGGSLMPLVRRRPDDFRGLFATAAIFFKRPDYAWAAGDIAPENLWLLGYTSPELFGSLLPTPPETAARHLYLSGGYTVMRNSWDNDAHHMIVDVGPLGCPYSSGHGHADLLSIQCSVFGQAYLVDPGTYCYTADKKWRNYFRSSFAHNTVVVDGTSQAIPDGPFSWEKKVKATMRRWIAKDNSVLIDADHDAYKGLADPVSHRRRVLFVNSQYWVVVDDLDGRAEHLLELAWQFAPMDVSLKPDSWVEARGRHEHGLRMRSFSSVPLQANLVSGSLEPVRGWVSPDYGQLIAAPQLVYTTRQELPVRIVTLILPVRDLSVTPPVIVQKMKGRTMILDLDDGRESIVINDHDILVKVGNIEAIYQHRPHGPKPDIKHAAVVHVPNEFHD